MDHLKLLKEAHSALVTIGEIIAARGKKDLTPELMLVYEAVAEALDDHSHSPLCPANHFHGSHTPAYTCSCGAWRHGVRMISHPALGMQ